MTQNYINTNKIKENKYKILRMSLILGADDNREETINNFEESAREIDAMNDETYLGELETKFYDTLKLEEEEQKLAALVDYIGGRVEQRISLLSDFANITGYDLSGLPPIKYYDKLDDYKERLKYIREYLSNSEQINKLEIEIEESETKLQEAYENKKTSEEYNSRNEEIILSKFNNIIRPLEWLKDINLDNIDSQLNNIISNVEESKKSLDIFLKSYTTLKGSGINYEEEVEYKSYVDNAKEIYYANKEQEYLLKIYKLLLNKEIEYSKIIVKRQDINEILNERLNLRNELEITENDILNPLYETLEKQYKDIEQQLNTIESIKYLTSLIETKKNEKNDLDQDNQKVEILSLLREFCIIDTYAEIEEPIITSEPEEIITNEFDKENIEETPIPFPDKPEEKIEEEINIPEDFFATSLEQSTKSTEQIIEESKEEIQEEPKDNQVISVEPASKLDLDLIQSKASKVMKRVGEMLGIKTEETKIVSITNEEPKQEKPKEEPKKDIPEESKEVFSKEETQEEIPVIVNNPLPDENPLFTSNMPDLNNEPVDPEDSNGFWFSSDMPDALNELPDLEVSNDNFFGDSNMPDLNFPDLKLDFGSNDMEEK